jgi:hypothetical protein
LQRGVHKKSSIPSGVISVDSKPVVVDAAERLTVVAVAADGVVVDPVVVGGVVVASPVEDVVVNKLVVESAKLSSSYNAPSEAELKAAVKIQSFVRMKSAKAELLQLQLVRTKRKNIGIEMLKTEETYVKTLDVLVNKIRVSMSTQSFRTAAGGVSEQDMKGNKNKKQKKLCFSLKLYFSPSLRGVSFLFVLFIIFGQIIFPASLSMLLSAHESWLAQLNVRIHQWSPQQCVGDLFLQLSPYLKM